MNGHVNAISHNPYRIVGVFATSTRKEIVANIARIKANLRVDKKIHFESDFEILLSDVLRNKETISLAESQISLPKEQVSHAQFWFLSLTEIDKIALGNLAVGNIDKAISIWEKKDNLTSIHNRVLSYLIKENYEEAIKLAQQFYSEYSEEFIKLILSDSSNVIELNLVHSFLDTLCESVNPQKISLYTTYKEWGEYVVDKIVQPLIDKIEHSISVAKESKKKDSQSRLNAGTLLMNETIEPLRKLKSELSSSNIRFQLIADKLGLEILQCGIDYFNDSEEDDAAFNAMKLQKYAQSIVVGKMAQDRCNENISILEGIISKLPPREVLVYHKAIQELLEEDSFLPETIQNAIVLLKKSAPYIVAIKSITGVKNDYYLNISTTIVNNALSCVINQVNSATRSQNTDFERIKSILIVAWKTMLYMDKFDLEFNFKQNRYNPNRESLHGLIDKVKGFDDASLSFMYAYGCGFCNDLDVSDLDLRTDDELFADCKNITICNQYIRNFPQGKHLEQVKYKLAEFKLQRCKTISDYENFIKSYSISSLIDKATKKLNLLKKEELERKKREEAVYKAIANCSTLNEVVSIYKKENSSTLYLDKCSIRAFEVSSTENDYNQVISIFGTRSKGGKQAQDKLNEIKQRKKERVEKNKKIRNILLLIGIPMAIILIVYLIWDIRGLATGCIAIAAISGFVAMGAMRDSDGCAIFFIAVAIAGVFGLAGAGLSSVAEDIEKERESSKLYEQIISNPTIEQCKTFVNRYEGSAQIKEVRNILLNQLIQEAKSFDYNSLSNSSYDLYAKQYNPIQELVEFADDNKYNEDGEKALSCLSIICDSLYNVAKKVSTIAGWRTYQKAVPTDYFKDSDSKIQEIENKSWDTEAKAWKMATSENTISAYYKYQKLYPYGKHFSQSEKRLIDLEVEKVYAGNHGTLPEMDRISYGGGSTSYITVSNSTSYTLTLLYSGPDSKRLVIPAGQTSSISLKNGTYRVAASVAASNVSNYAGSENLKGGSYSVDYYISTYRY